MCSKQKMSYSVFVLNHVAKCWNVSTTKAYQILNDTHILDDYVIKCYDTLHTQGERSIVEDITELVREKGIAI